MSRLPTDAALNEVVRLISMDTTSRNSNLPLIDHVVALLKGVGIESALVPNADGTKTNLLASFPAADGSVTGGIVLSAHTDVVPVDGQPWSSDPFTAEVRDQRLYGRGSTDMKSFLAVILSKLSDFVAQPLAEPIHLALSYDEEVGCVGAVSLVDRIIELGLKPRGCIVGEPTSMQIIRGHKSMNTMSAHFRGVAAHSSLTPQGVNAIAYAARFVDFVEEVAADFRTNGPFDDAFPVPFTTTTANMISGGIAINTIPADCTVDFEFRGLVAVDPDELIARYRAEADRLDGLMKQANPAAGVDFQVNSSSPGLDGELDSEIVRLATAWGGEPSEGKVTYGTEAGLFFRAGIPTVVCGPGDIAQAHTPDEFIDLEQIARCEDFIDQVIAHARG
ncbi:MAG: acetylornithine deacetylase [Micropruina sp.]|uniref:acetylornithine deacetylase n=1 Tax=Micropruina sp. TaxID=2737536 RepID=UPI0039E56C5E